MVRTQPPSQDRDASPGVTQGVRRGPTSPRRGEIRTTADLARVVSASLRTSAYTLTNAAVVDWYALRVAGGA